MKTWRALKEVRPSLALGVIAALAVLWWLLIRRLGSLTGGLSAGEIWSATVPVGWHGMYHHPFYLPLLIVRSIFFAVWPHHGQTLTRLPNALFGGVSIVVFYLLMRLWHGTRTALFASLLFAVSAWTLHVSRLASFDVMYLWGILVLLVTHGLLQRFYDRPLAVYSCVIAWGLLLYIPGFIWFLLWNIWLQKAVLLKAWQETGWRHRIGYKLIGLVWLPLLVIDLLRPGQLMAWLGLPAHWPAPVSFLKQLAGVPIHLFVRGPQYPNLWVGRAPLLDVFCLAMAVIGIYFYVSHVRAGRSRLLTGLAVIGVLLVALGGPVGLSVLVPLLFVAVAAGLAYFLREWLRTFPLNPLARGAGIGLLSLAVLISCIYNLQAYFTAWPHNQTTASVFRYRR